MNCSGGPTSPSRRYADWLLRRRNLGMPPKNNRGGTLQLHSTLRLYKQLCAATQERSRHDENRDVLLLFSAGVPVQGYHLCAQRCARLPVLQVEMVGFRTLSRSRWKVNKRSHKNFKMKRNPRKLAWTKSFRKFVHPLSMRVREVESADKMTEHTARK